MPNDAGVGNSPLGRSWQPLEVECHSRAALYPTLYPVDSSEAERPGTWPEKKPQESWQLAQAPPTAPGWAGLLWLAAPCLPDCDVVGEVL